MSHHLPISIIIYGVQFVEFDEYCSAFQLNGLSNAIKLAAFEGWRRRLHGVLYNEDDNEGTVVLFFLEMKSEMRFMAGNSSKSK